MISWAFEKTVLPRCTERSFSTVPSEQQQRGFAVLSGFSWQLPVNIHTCQSEVHTLGFPVTNSQLKCRVLCSG